jgi:hypothetical protein
MAYDSLMVFTGNANPKLAADVVKRLNISLGRPMSGVSPTARSAAKSSKRARQGRLRPAADLQSRPTTT